MVTYNLHSILIGILSVSLIFTISTTQAEELNSAIIKGQREFIDACSLCHGESAKGDGIFSSMLTISTPDLTKLSKYNNGIFPYKNVYLIIDGTDQIKPHGSRRMPIWGNRFKIITWYTINQDYADTLVRGKIFELALYLESIQE
jgi:hypothetical protein